MTELDSMQAARPLPPEFVRSLEHKLRIELTYSSNSIEGNTLTLRETIAEISSAFLVEAHGRLELQGRLGMELVPHLASRRSMRR